MAAYVDGASTRRIILCSTQCEQLTRTREDVKLTGYVALAVHGTWASVEREAFLKLAA